MTSLPVAHDSSLVAGRAITVKVVPQSVEFRPEAETGGRYSWESEEVDSTFDSTSVTTGISPEQGRFYAEPAGFYYIEAGERIRGETRSCRRRTSTFPGRIYPVGTVE